MLRVLEINDLETLSVYRRLWQRFLEQTRGASFFQSFEWLEAYWRHHGANQRLRVLLVYSGDTMLGILPLVVRREATRAGQVRVLTYPLHDWGTFYGPIGPNPAAVLAAGLQHIARTPKDWEMLDLRWIDEERVDHGRSEAALLMAGMTPNAGIWTQSAQVEIEGDWATYWGGRKAKHRENIRRAERQLARLGEVTFERYRPRGAAFGDADPRWDLYNECEALAARSWQGQSETGTTLSHPEVREFLRDAHAAAVQAGAADICLLRIDGVAVAFAYNYACQGYVYGLRMGYDPALEREGAGAVVLARALEDSFERGDQIYDLGPGALDIKRHWTTRLANSRRQTHYRYTPRAQGLRLKQAVQGWVRGGAAQKAGNKALAIAG
jgi:CelD/BcsL family acetyltransferase involved in cellulose biosynthesis